LSQEHAATLLNLTGDLFPVGASTQQQLSELRQILLASLLGGETPSDMGSREFAGDPVNGAAEEIAALGDAPPPASADRVARRSAAIRAVDQVTGGPQWPLAQTPGRTLGPFQDGGGGLHWFDIYSFTNFFFIDAQGAPGSLAFLPLGTVRVLGSPTLTIPAGSLWLSGPLIHASAPAGSWAGFRITGGTAAIPGPFQLAGGGLILGAQFGSGLALHVTLDTQGLAGFPSTVSIGISANAIRMFDLVPGSVTAFGNTVNLTPANLVPTVSGYDPALRSLLFPMTPDAAMFTVAPVDGALFPISGSAAIQSAAWAVPVTVVSSLSDAEGPGALVVTVQAGLEGELPGTAGGSAELNQSTIMVTPGRTTVFSANASNPNATQTVNAWFEDSSTQRSSVEITRDATFLSWFFRPDSGAQALVTRALVALQIDRPMQASGERLGSRFRAFHILEQDDSDSRMALVGRAQSGTAGVIALALPNALLTVDGPVALQLNAILNGPGEMQSGAIHVFFALFRMLPALPDPYVTNFDPRRGPPTEAFGLNANVIWTEPLDAHLDMAFNPPAFNLQSMGAALPIFPVLLPPNANRPDAFSHLNRQELNDGLALLDVSSNAAQLGMAIGTDDRPGGGFSIHDLNLNVGGANSLVFLLPQFQCEPVFNKKNPRIPSEVEGALFFEDDGDPMLAAAETVRLVPVQPFAVLAEVVRSYMEDRNNAGVLFSLPFGIQAAADLQPLDPQFRTLPQLEIVAPRFDGFDGAPQLSLIAGTTLTNGTAWIAGQAMQMQNRADSVLDNTLGAVIGPAFNLAFQSGVPIDRIGLSGYGANIFSRWINNTTPDVGVTQVAFDGINGRTSFERVMMTSYLLPCCARVVRTITLERYGNGSVVRWDSGWLATTPGDFFHGNTYKFHQGPVFGIKNIREISDTDYTVTLSGGAVMQAVYYDADVQIEGVLRGAGTNGYVPARRHLGFVQQLTVPPPVGPGGPLSAQLIDSAHMAELLRTNGRIGGPIDCQWRVGSSLHEMKISGVFVDNASNDEFVVGVYGTPSLRAAGQWSVVRTNNTTHVTEAVDTSAGIPMIHGDTGGFRWADPVDLLAASPANDYGFLFSSKMQRILFSRPKIDDAATKITSLLPPLLADPYSLLKAPGLFPDASQVIPFDLANWGLESAAGTLQLTPTPFTVTVNKAGFDLLQASDWGAKLSYNDELGGVTRFVIDSAADWVIKGTGVEQVLTFPLVGEVMRVAHEINAPAIGDGTFPNPQILFDKALSEVADILNMLKTWAPDLPAPLHVEPSFSGSTFRLNAVADFNITDSDGNAIDCGMGKLKGELKLGFDLSVELFNRTVDGSIFFEVTGSWQQMVFPFIYGGGLMRFFVGANLSGGTSLELDAAVTGSVGGDIIPLLVSLEATVRYGYFLATNPIAPGFLVGIEGRAKLLSGLLGFKLSIDGRIAISRKDDPLDPDDLCRLHGEILIAGTVTVAWLVDERKSFRTHFDVKVGWELALLAAKEAILPVP
jgi:hypothetical protein